MKSNSKIIGNNITKAAIFASIGLINGNAVNAI